LRGLIAARDGSAQTFPNGTAVVPLPAVDPITSNPDSALKRSLQQPRPPTVIDCPDDGAAIENAKELLDGRVIQVWDHDRLIVRLDPDD
jgi:hypothetical protein